MLHMSSTHQMQQIQPNDLTLICPYVGVMGVGVWCSPSETGPEQAKKPNLSMVMANFRKNMVRTPPPNPSISEKPFSRAFRIYPTYPPPSGHSAGTNQATMATTPENAPCWHDPHRPREICILWATDDTHQPQHLLRTCTLIGKRPPPTVLQ